MANRTVLLLLLITFLISCKKDKPEAPTPAPPPIPVKNELIFINNGYQTLYDMDLHMRIYYPKQDVTNFTNKRGDVSVYDSLGFDIRRTPYKGCSYQYMLYWTEKITQDSANHVQYRSYTDTLQAAQSTFIIDWPKDSVLFEKIH